ncbi:MAG: flagellar motor protein MotB [Bacteroidetes bacterium GWE2_41_25]|nr:MAG: flagellar motor protein MotB [Bacteroidetes bacterium GWA2_40_15]OFX91610.1 MAG: flagellar motor protein MotB [Bacteroidetes bacterium GWE2_41_25]HBQ81263.1 flagellar motor protein MotB [Bacteroidales bacterium]HCU18976.1 flagellar motor protein MotB [Bacteroidales bacterium]
MKAETKFKKRSQTMWSHYTLMIKAVIISALVLMGIQTSLQGQDNKYTKPSWWFGGAAGANLNFYRGSTQELNADLIVPAIFHDGFGVGLYLAPLLEFHKPDTRLGFMLQAGFDSRKGKFDQIVNPCNCPADLSAKLTYLTIEPSLRLAPFKSNFYLYGGPRLAFDMAKSFKYDEGINPDYPDQENPPEITGDFSNMRSSVFSMQIGAGYDINLSSPDKQGQAVLSPFVSFQPYFGQDPRSIETWNITTVRVGAALKFGKGKKIEQPVKAAAVVVVPDPEVKFTVNSPTNIPVQRRVRETFPVRNYVFFDSGSAKISDRYVLITKDQVKDFKEDRLETFTPKQLSGRSQRQMTVYYNVLNILGDRMGRFPATVVRLSGASMEGTEDGLAMAESIKKYLVDIFGIEPGRINTEGRIKPRIPSEQPGATKELDMLREGDRRVTIWSESPELMMQYQTGPNTPLKPVEFVGVQEAPVDSYITFNVEGAEEALTSWSVEVKDDAGKVQNFGPYSKEKVSIPGKTILGTRPEGNYKVTMVGKTKSGKTVRQETPVHMVLWTPPENEEALRYSIIFEINDSDAINIYEKYLTDVVTPKIPKDGTVIIHGHTDIIGNDVHNQELSLARANEVSGIMKSALSKTGRTDVKFEVLGFGEDETLAPFENKYPEERFYNRSVIIDIIPSGK